jgi:hypothetical protein
MGALHRLKLDAKGARKENRSLAAAKLALVEKKLSELARLRDVLRDLVAACDQPHRGMRRSRLCATGKCCLQSTGSENC